MTMDSAYLSKQYGYGPSGGSATGQTNINDALRQAFAQKWVSANPTLADSQGLPEAEFQTWLNQQTTESAGQAQ